MPRTLRTLLPALTTLFSLIGLVSLIGLAAAGHQGWSANLYTLTSDTFPRSAVASVVGLGGFGLQGLLLRERRGRAVYC